VRAVVITFVVLVACGGVRHDTLSRYQGMILATRALGAERLRQEVIRNPAVLAWVAREGDPDFVYVAGPDELQLVYVQASRLAHFQGDGAEPTVLSPLPSGLLALLPADVGAGTPRAVGGTSCWTVSPPTGARRTCCRTARACTTEPAS
jgi:hypothetical protein